MSIAPTWDLLIIVIFIVVSAYSFIVRASGTAKMILSCYVGILAADGLGNVLYEHFAGPDPTVRLFNFSSAENTIVTFKITCFVLIVVLIALKGAYDSNLAEESGGLTGLGITAVLGFLNAGLVVSAVFVYITGGSFLTGIGYSSGELALSIYEQSQLAQIMIDYSSLWFSLPAIAFITASIMAGE